MTLVLSIRGEIVDSIEMYYRECITYACKAKKNQLFADYFKRHYSEEIMIAKDWDIYLVAESKMNKNVQTIHESELPNKEQV